jgi:hypothetical protein
MDDEFHRRVIVVEQQHLELAGLLGLGPRARGKAYAGATSVVAIAIGACNNAILNSGPKPCPENRVRWGRFASVVNGKSLSTKKKPPFRWGRTALSKCAGSSGFLPPGRRGERGQVL